MKFDQLLQIYWTKGFFFNNKLISFNLSISELTTFFKNFNFFHKFLFYKRFEFFFLTHISNFLLSKFKLNFRKIINMYISQFFNINHSSNELIKYIIIRFYLIKIFKGKCHFLNKPCHGQRTWSNANNVKKVNNFLKPFIMKIIKSFKKITKINYKNKKIIKLKKKKIIMKIKTTKKKINNWF